MIGKVRFSDRLKVWFVMGVAARGLGRLRTEAALARGARVVVSRRIENSARFR